MARTPSEIDALVRELAGSVTNPLEPSPDALRALLSIDPRGPFQFLNLLAYHDTARYPDGHALASAGTTGAAAYALYGAVAVRHVTARGGRLTHLNAALLQLIGEPVDWHQIAIMQYPSVDAFVDMVRDPDYRAALVHRDAGLARTQVFVTRALLPEGVVP